MTVRPHGADAGLGRGRLEPAGRVDEELLALPLPPRGKRLAVMVLMAAVVAACLGTIAALGPDIAYFFASDRARDLGAAPGVRYQDLRPNTFVRVQGTPMLSQVVEFRNLLSTSEYAIFPLAGQRDIFVQVPASYLDDASRLARGEFSGRLTSFEQLGRRMRTVRDYLYLRMELPVSQETFVIRVGEPPGSYAWALAVAALCVAGVLCMVWLMLRWFRPLAPTTTD